MPKCFVACAQILDGCLELAGRFLELGGLRLELDRLLLERFALLLDGGKELGVLDRLCGLTPKLLGDREILLVVAPPGLRRHQRQRSDYTSACSQRNDDVGTQ